MKKAGTLEICRTMRGMAALKSGSGAAALQNAPDEKKDTATVAA
jgi:hypothetical protein